MASQELPRRRVSHQGEPAIENTSHVESSGGKVEARNPPKLLITAQPETEEPPETSALDQVSLGGRTGKPPRIVRFEAKELPTTPAVDLVSLDGRTGKPPRIVRSEAKELPTTSEPDLVSLGGKSGRRPISLQPEAEEPRNTSWLDRISIGHRPGAAVTIPPSEATRSSDDPGPIPSREVVEQTRTRDHVRTETAGIVEPEDKVEIATLVRSSLVEMKPDVRKSFEFWTSLLEEHEAPLQGAKVSQEIWTLAAKDLARRMTTQYPGIRGELRDGLRAWLGDVNARPDRTAVIASKPKRPSLVDRFVDGVRDLVKEVLVELGKESLLAFLGVHAVLPPTGLVSAVFAVCDMLDIAEGW